MFPQSCICDRKFIEITHKSDNKPFAIQFQDSEQV